MARFSSMVITLPVILLPFAAVVGKPAMAETAAPLEAVEILAKSGTAGQKCHVLSASEQTELEAYGARAEVAVAQRFGASEAHDAVMAGRTIGSGAKCTDATARQVREALAAARVAVAQLPGSRQTPRRISLFPPKPAVLRLSAPPVMIDTAAVNGTQPGSLSRFKSHATAYYIEQRCRFLPYSKAQIFWRSVLKGQTAAIAANGSKPVKTALSQARMTASAVSCDGRSARVVRLAYGKLAFN